MRVRSNGGNALNKFASHLHPVSLPERMAAIFAQNEAGLNDRFRFQAHL
jgi:hypothetical protein